MGYRCTCTHAYGEHDTRREVENSLEAFMLPGPEATPEAIEALPERAPEPCPAIGACGLCSCKEYRYRPISLPELDRHLVYGILEEDSLVFIPRSRAHLLAATWYAIDTSKTWKEFRDKMPVAEYEETMRLDFDDEGEPRPNDSDAFDYEVVTGDDLWPSNPWDDMVDILPETVVELGGVKGMFEFFEIDAKEEPNALQLLHAEGFQTERDDDLVAKACGHWNGAHFF